LPPVKYPDCHPLIVDDDPDFIFLITRSLERVGVPRLQVRSSQNGEEAIKLLSKDDWIPSVILLDLHMPRRNGLEVLEWIRSASSPMSQVPVFMLTSDSHPDHVARAFQLGVGSYFIKPTEVGTLEDVLEGILAYWKSRHRPALIRGSLRPSTGENR
jgi:CheY-like chemotaxis protein